MQDSCPNNNTLCLKDDSTVKDTAANKCVSEYASIVLSQDSCPYNDTFCLKNDSAIKDTAANKSPHNAMNLQKR